MSLTAKVWIIRIGSLPVLLYLPVFCAMPGGVILRENEGDSMPWLTAAGFCIGFAAAAVLSRWTVFMPKEFPFARGFKILASIVLFESALLSGLWIWVGRAEEEAEPATTAQRGQPSVIGRFTGFRNSILARPAWLI